MKTHKYNAAHLQYGYTVAVHPINWPQSPTVFYEYEENIGLSLKKMGLIIPIYLLRLRVFGHEYSPGRLNWGTKVLLADIFSTKTNKKLVHHNLCVTSQIKSKQIWAAALCMNINTHTFVSLPVPLYMSLGFMHGYPIFPNQRHFHQGVKFSCPKYFKNY